MLEDIICCTDCKVLTITILKVKMLIQTGPFKSIKIIHIRNLNYYY